MLTIFLPVREAWEGCRVAVTVTGFNSSAVSWATIEIEIEARHASKKNLIIRGFGEAQMSEAIELWMSFRCHSSTRGLHPKSAIHLK